MKSKNTRVHVTTKERCVNAIMDKESVSQEIAEKVCDLLLNDPIFVDTFVDNPDKYEWCERQNTEEDLFVAKCADRYDMHLELSTAIYREGLKAGDTDE